MFGTFKDPETFVPRCGYKEGREQQFFEMRAFQDVNNHSV